MDLGHVALESALQGNNALNEEGVCVMEVEVHHSHHGDTHHLGAHHGLDLGVIVGVDGGRDKLALLGGAHRCRLNILEGCHICSDVGLAHFGVGAWPRPGLVESGGRTLLLVHDGLDIESDTENDHVAEHVGSPAHVEHTRVIERDLLGYLHHTQDDDQVRTVGASTCQYRGHL